MKLRIGLRSKCAPRKNVLLAALVLCLSGGVPSVRAQSTDGSEPFRNASLPVEQRVADLIGRMTLEEKVAQMRDHAAAIPRLGVPKYDWWNEGLHGVAFAGTATNFPQVIGMAATWDTSLVHRMGEVISTEARAKYNQAMRDDQHEMFFGLTFWAPNINIFRDPRWGRGQETYGEDPFLTGRMGVAFVSGMQGDDPRFFRVISTPKHFAVHSGPEPTRHSANVDISAHDLEDTYLPAFRAAVTEAHAQSVMCAYNSIDGAPACANTMLLADHLRHDWGFDGYVVSDCAAVADVFTGHHYTPDMAHAAAAALKAGTDLECGFGKGQAYPALVDAVHQGLISHADLDQALRRLFRARFRLGMFDAPSSYAYGRIGMDQNNTPEHRALSLQAARESMVLLKNDGVLPLKSSVRHVAVVGPTAQLVQALQGNYNGPPQMPVSPLEAMEKRLGGQAVSYAQGATLVEGFAMPIPRTALRPASGSGQGLTAEYFAARGFTGQPVLTRTDAFVNFNWDKFAPVAGLQRNNYSVRWSGSFVPPAAGDYRLGVRVNYCYACENAEGFKLFLDGKVILESGQRKTGERGSAQDVVVHMNGTAAHALKLEYEHGAGSAGIDLIWQAPAQTLREEAVDAARQADVVVAFVGLSPSLEGEEMPVKLPGFAGGDRTSIDLPATQQAMLEALGATGKPLVVILQNGSALAVNWAAQHAAAILEAWYPGEEGGTAIAETLAGANNPAGRLPLTFYRSTDQLPAFTDYAMSGRTYRYFAGQPLFRFGDGLSYTTFAYSNVRAHQSKLHAGEPLTVEADVKNTGRLAGDEVAELYLTQPKGEGTPLRVLAGFQRFHLGAGASRHVSFTVTPRALSQVDGKGRHVILPGEYDVFVGGAQPREAAGAGDHVRFNVEGQSELPQ